MPNIDGETRKNFTEVYNLSKSKKLLSMLLAMIMVFSTFAVGASAAYADYKDEAIKSYDSIDNYNVNRNYMGSMKIGMEYYINKQSARRSHCKTSDG